MMIQYLSKIIKLALICVIILEINPAIAQTNASLLFANGIGNSSPLGGDIVSKMIKIDASGNRYVTGYFKSTADFDPGSSTANLTSAGNTDIFIAKYDASRNYVWAKGMGITGENQGNFPAFVIVRK